MDSFFDMSPPNTDGAARRKAVHCAQKILDDEFHALGAEIGWFYPDLDVNGEGKETNHDGQLKDSGRLDLLYYHPSIIPGHHLPHAWLEKGNERLSTRDMVKYDGFVLIASRPGLWKTVVAEAGGGLVNLIGISDAGEKANSEESLWKERKMGFSAWCR
ncbi:uncharacterized protein Z519_11032 [Cladophialophora bantiana CBS 173.52]|uniref:Uncharacterized protein n=1 Tax=Cladophialophora bantiana (strain ATCC 10958 / CBS 173.52 / CDC B-1940 / NIH 8579) TaxID=1442370 RepID=A0A0D2H585_CLAB1|nr:uncharacterized protein Z519_11032 [Cladophialophora bantiana CBS 173.52]KIW88463.1 hypothetical protein Z519_11032 [Cladophialophora bantiana CBS 173.52]